MTDLQRALTENLKSLRRRRGWSQSDLAERCGLSVSYIGDLEVGSKWPAADKLERLAEAFSIHSYELLMDASESQLYRAWLERRDVVAEIGEQLWRHFEKRLP